MSRRPIYKCPSRNLSVLGHGNRRSDGQMSDRRRPPSSSLGTPSLRAEARALPLGDGVNLTDRQRMILCFLPPLDRHKRADRVFNARGEFYRAYKYMTTKPAAFLAAVGMPRIGVPRHAGDRPTSRNDEQVRLEQADIAARCQRGFASLVQAPPAVGVNPQYHLINATLCLDLVHADALMHLTPKTDMNQWVSSVLFDLHTMDYDEACAAILQDHGLFQQAPELYIGVLHAYWVDSTTGYTLRHEVYEHNWHEEVVPFLLGHPTYELSLNFGVGVVRVAEAEAFHGDLAFENDAHENHHERVYVEETSEQTPEQKPEKTDEEWRACIDPALLGL